MSDIWEKLCQLWQSWMGDTFISGYWLAVALVGVVVVLWLLIHLVCWLLWRRHRVSSLRMPSKDGDIEVANQAIFQMVSTLDRAFPMFQVDKMRLYRRGRKYTLSLAFFYAPLDAGGQALTADVQAFKLQICERLHELFGITDIARIDMHLVKLSKNRTAAPAESRD